VARACYLPSRDVKKRKKNNEKKIKNGKRKRQQIPKKTQLWIVGIFAVCFEC